MNPNRNLYEILMSLPYEERERSKDPEYFIRRWVASPEDRVEVAIEPWQGPHAADRIAPAEVEFVQRIRYTITQPDGYWRVYHFAKEREK